MRRGLKVVWLDDANGKAEVDILQEDLQIVIEGLGYDIDFYKEKEYNSALNVLQDKKLKIDFFITDYNLGRGETGIDFVKKIREVNSYKQLIILYSNLNYKELKKDVIKLVNDEGSFIFSNFIFLSVERDDNKEQFEKAVQIILCRWDELNAIRGQYLSEFSELENRIYQALLVCNKGMKDKSEYTYGNLWAELKRGLSNASKRTHSRVIKKIDESVRIRNALAHIKEGYSDKDGFYIESVDLPVIRISENCISEERKKLLEMMDELVDFISKYENRKVI